MERIKAIQECECWAYVMIYNKPSAPPLLPDVYRDGQITPLSTVKHMTSMNFRSIVTKKFYTNERR